MQIPTGIMADTWGPRRLLSSGALVAGTGTLLFALEHNRQDMVFARIRGESVCSMQHTLHRYKSQLRNAEIGIPMIRKLHVCIF